MLNLSEFKDTALLRVSITAWGNSRKGNLSDSAILQIIGQREGETVEDQRLRIEEAKKRLRLSKTLVDSTEYQAIIQWRAMFMKNLVKRWVNKSFLDEGLYVVRINALEQIVGELGRGLSNMSMLVNRFMEVYRARMEEAKRVLNGQFDEANYPSEATVRQAFGLTYRIIRLEVPEGLPPEIRKEEEAKLRKSYEEARISIMAALWAEYKAYLDHIVDRLQPNPDGSRKKFESTLFGNLASFVEFFNTRNAFNDAKLADLVKASRNILVSLNNGQDIDPSKLSDAAANIRKDEGLRNATAGAFDKIKSAVAENITDAPKRDFNFGE